MNRWHLALLSPNFAFCTALYNPQSSASLLGDLPQEPEMANGSTVTTAPPVLAANSAAVGIAGAELQAAKEALLQSQNEVKSLQEKHAAAVRALEAKIAALQSEVGARADDASASQCWEAKIAEIEQRHAETMEQVYVWLTIKVIAAAIS